MKSSKNLKSRESFRFFVFWEKLNSIQVDSLDLGMKSSKKLKQVSDFWPFSWFKSLTHNDKFEFKTRYRPYYTFSRFKGSVIKGSVVKGSQILFEKVIMVPGNFDMAHIIWVIQPIHTV